MGYFEVATGEGQQAPRAVKLVRNIVLSMPSPTPPEKVLAAARTFAREKFAGQHRYAMVLHLCGVVVYVEGVPQPGFGGAQQGSHST